MTPTLDSGDGFVAVPPSLVGGIEPGDVVTFRAETLHGGGLTTHRVVEETQKGFITKGDANPFTDQDGGEPPVQRGQIVAVAWQPGGDVLAIPHLGTVIEEARNILASTQRWLAAVLGTRSLLGETGFAYLLFALSASWYTFEVYRDNGTKRDRSRSPSREEGTDPRLIVGVFTLVIVLSATAGMVGPAGTNEYKIVSTERDSTRPGFIQSGTTETVRYRVDNGGVLPVFAYLESGGDGVAVDPASMRVGPRSIMNATVTLSAPSEPGTYNRFVIQHRYLAVLPASHIDALYRVHPWLPVFAIDTLLGVPFYVAGVALVGRGQLRSYSRPNPSRTRRLLNRFR
jgi:signal peptidase